MQFKCTLKWYIFLFWSHSRQRPSIQKMTLACLHLFLSKHETPLLVHLRVVIVDHIGRVVGGKYVIAEMQAFCRWAGLHIILRYLLFKTEGILRKKATRLCYALMRMPHYSLKVPYFDFAKYYNMIFYQYIHVCFNITQCSKKYNFSLI